MLFQMSFAPGVFSASGAWTRPSVCLTDIKVEVNWRPFFLDPTIPAEGMSRRTYLENKFGAERLKTLHDPILAAGKEDGVPYAFDKITRTPNTMDAHRLIRWSHDGGQAA